MTLTTVVRSKAMVATIVMAFAAQAVIFVIVGRLLSMDAAQKSAMLDLEEKVHYCAATGAPIFFDKGRLGVILDTKTARNGKTIAFRVMSFVLPEDVEMRWSPVETIRRPAAFKSKKARSRRAVVSKPTTS